MLDNGRKQKLVVVADGSGHDIEFIADENTSYECSANGDLSIRHKFGWTAFAKDRWQRVWITTEEV